MIRIHHVIPLSIAGAALLTALGCGTTMTGHVTEDGTTTPVSGALVQVGEETAYTDRQGRYELEVEDEETHDVYVSAPAYKSHSQQLRVRDQDTLAMSFELRPQEKDGQQLSRADRDEKPTEVTVNASASSESNGEDRTQPASSPRTDRADSQTDRADSQTDESKTDESKAGMTDVVRGMIQSVGLLPNAEHSRSVWIELPTQRVQKVRMYEARFEEDWMKVGKSVEVTGHYEWIDGERILIAHQIEPLE